MLGIYFGFNKLNNNKQNMKPLILEYFEKNKNDIHEEIKFEYSNKLNLCVLTGTEEPAIEVSNMDTRTFTKSDTESSDSDTDLISVKNLLDTATHTLYTLEASDSDNDVRGMQMLFDTRTITESAETSDQDK